MAFVSFYRAPRKTAREPRHWTRSECRTPSTDQCQVVGPWATLLRILLSITRIVTVTATTTIMDTSSAIQWAWHRRQSCQVSVEPRQKLHLWMHQWGQARLLKRLIGLVSSRFQSAMQATRRGSGSRKMSLVYISPSGLCLVALGNFVAFGSGLCSVLLHGSPIIILI